MHFFLEWVRMTLKVIDTEFQKYLKCKKQGDDLELKSESEPVLSLCWGRFLKGQICRERYMHVQTKTVNLTFNLQFENHLRCRCLFFVCFVFRASDLIS